MNSLLIILIVLVCGVLLFLYMTAKNRILEEVKLNFSFIDNSGFGDGKKAMAELLKHHKFSANTRDDFNKVDLLLDGLFEPQMLPLVIEKDYIRKQIDNILKLYNSNNYEKSIPDFDIEAISKKHYGWKLDFSHFSAPLNWYAIKNELRLRALANQKDFLVYSTSLLVLVLFVLIAWVLGVKIFDDEIMATLLSLALPSILLIWHFFNKLFTDAFAKRIAIQILKLNFYYKVLWEGKGHRFFRGSFDPINHTSTRTQILQRAYPNEKFLEFKKILINSSNGNEEKNVAQISSVRLVVHFKDEVKVEGKSWEQWKMGASVFLIKNDFPKIIAISFPFEILSLISDGEGEVLANLLSFSDLDNPTFHSKRVSKVEIIPSSDKSNPFVFQ